MSHILVINTKNSTSFTTVLDPAMTLTPFNNHARTNTVPAPTSRSTLQCCETAPLNHISLNSSHFARPPSKEAPCSSISLSSRISDTSQTPTETVFLSEKNIQPMALDTVSTQAGLRNSQTNNIGLTNAQGVKRRLGMGRCIVGYSNKKFKPPM
jgi:DNA helicase II / ATP-dependent DNA helicase PcrA